MKAKDRIDIIRKHQKYRREANICYPYEKLTEGDDFVNDKHCADEIAVFCSLIIGVCIIILIGFTIIKMIF